MKSSYKIIFLGSTAVGKTTLIYRYVSDEGIESEPTIGLDFFSTSIQLEDNLIEHKDKSLVRLQLWDTAGQERYSTLIIPYLRDSYLAIIVYAVNDIKSFENLNYWVNEYKSNAQNKPNILIVANKRDYFKNEKIDKTTLINDDLGREFAQKVGARFCTASANSKDEIKEIVANIKETIAEDINENPVMEKSKESKLQKTASSRKGCC